MVVMVLLAAPPRAPGRAAESSVVEAVFAYSDQMEGWSAGMAHGPKTDEGEACTRGRRRLFVSNLQNEA